MLIICYVYHHQLHIGTLNCGSAMHQCEYSCSNASHWTEWSAVPSSEMNVSKYTCQSEKAVIKNRSNSLSGRNCNERGQFCESNTINYRSGPSIDSTIHIVIMYRCSIKRRKAGKQFQIGYQHTFIGDTSSS